MRTTIKHSLAAIAALLCLTACNKSSAENQNPDNAKQTTMSIIIDSVAPGDAFVNIETSLGNIRIQLYGDTPLHRDNFIKLAREGYYDGVLFHRVIKNFMVQTGDPDSKTAQPGQQLGSGDPGYTIPAEFVYPKHFHRYGAIAAARTGDNVNPERRSSGSQFYIVTGDKYPEGRLNQMELQLRQRARREVFDSLSIQNRDKIISLRREGKTEELNTLRDQILAETDTLLANSNVGFTPQQREAYQTVGGTPHLDGQYTVYGQVVEGMDVVEKIQNVETNSFDRPTDDIKILKVTVE